MRSSWVDDDRTTEVVLFGYGKERERGRDVGGVRFVLDTLVFDFNNTVRRDLYTYFSVVLSTYILLIKLTFLSMIFQHLKIKNTPPCKRIDHLHLPDLILKLYVFIPDLARTMYTL